MKKFVPVLFILLLVLAIFGCRSAPPPDSESFRFVPGGFPDPIREALLNVPEGSLVGIGTARFPNNLSHARTIATARARAEISRQINSMVDDMIRDYQATSEVDPAAALSFQENITVTLSRSEVSGSRAVEYFTDVDATVWVVVVMDRADIVREISQAQSAARLAVPAMMSFDAEARMNEAFARLYNAEIQVRSVD